MISRIFVIAAMVGSFVSVSTRSASAQELVADAAATSLSLPSSLFTSALASAPLAPAPAAPLQPYRFGNEGGRSSNLLSSLYVSTMALQALDVHSTYSVINKGGAEGNPIMSGLVQHKVVFIALKAGIAASTIMAARQMAKHNKVAAIVTLVAMNSVYAMVVSHNYGLAHDMR